MYLKTMETSRGDQDPRTTIRLRWKSIAGEVAAPVGEESCIGRDSGRRDLTGAICRV